MTVFLLGPFKALFQSATLTVRQINQKYATPRIKITPMVKAALVILRLYLILLLAILLYKFITILRAR